jgi:hypothetical protein
VAVADRVRLRRDGWITVAGLVPGEDPLVEARRIGCSHAYLNGEVVTITA